MVKATLTRSGNLISVSPPFKDLLAPHLSYRKRLQAGGDPSKATYVPTDLYHVPEDGSSLIAPAGLTARITRVLKQADVSVELVDLRVERLPEPDLSKLAKLRSEQIDILSKILAYDWLTVEAPPGSGKSFLLKQLCKIWPTSKILICCPFSSVLNQTLEELKAEFTAGEVGLVGLGSKETDCRITLTTDKSLHRCDLDGARLFMYDECHRGASDKGAAVIGTIRNAKHIGFSASPYGRSDGGDLETEALFGPCVCKITYEEVQATGSVVPIEVRMVSCKDIPNYEVIDKSSLERRCLWRHNSRNAKIRDAVRAALEELGDVQVLISVKTVDHAVHLHKLLPDFELAYASMDREKMLSWINNGYLPEGYEPLNREKLVALQKSFREGTLRKAIATGVWGTGANFPQLTVLVRADAQSGDIASTQIPGRVTRKIAGKDCGYVIDFSDEFNSILCRRALQRKRGYSKKGWTVTAVD